MLLPGLWTSAASMDRTLHCSNALCKHYFSMRALFFACRRWNWSRVEFYRCAIAFDAHYLTEWILQNHSKNAAYD